MVFTLRRTAALVRAFRLEQSDPAAFYGLLAEDSVGLVARWAPLAGALVLDVGGGPGHFAPAFTAAGSRYVSCDVGGGTVTGDARALPFADGAADVCFSSNVLEHVPDPEAVLRELVRVTAGGGTVFVAFTNWLGPLGGHETAPWHYLGGTYAARRYTRVQGRPPKNLFGRTLFPLSVARVLRWVRNAPGVEAVAVFPRYHPRWAHWVVRVPGLREVLTANCVVVLRVRPR